MNHSRMFVFICIHKSTAVLEKDLMLHIRITHFVFRLLISVKEYMAATYSLLQSEEKEKIYFS